MPGPASTSSNTRPSSTMPGQRPAVNTQTKVLDTVQGRLLCIADIRGNLSHLNTLAAEANAKAIIHTGDFGFIDAASLDRISDRTLRHLIMYSPLITMPHRNRILAPENTPSTIREMIATSTTPLLSDFPRLLSGEIKLSIPVYTVYGACEDVAVLERFRAGQYNIENLHVIDEATTRCIDIGGVKFRLLGLGGAFVPHKLFDNGDGQATIAGGQGTMWTTALQVGELVDTAQRVYDVAETRVLVSHASPGREGLIAQLALAVKADLTISAGLHFRYPTSYNEFSVQSDFEGFRSKLLSSKENFEKIWDAVKSQVEAVLDDNQKVLLEKALSVVERVPPPIAAGSADENAWKNCWNWNLTDAAFGQLILDIKEGRVNAEMRSQGFNYAYRRQATPTTPGPAGQDSGLVPPAGQNQPGGASIAPGSVVPTKPGTPAFSKSTTPAPNLKPTSPSISKSGTPAPEPELGSADKDKDASKRDKKKQKDKEKKAERAAERASNGEVNGQEGGKKDKKFNEGVRVDTGSVEGPTGLDDGLAVSPSAETGGGHTPTSRRGPRNPWTLFVKHLPVPVTEEEVKEFFGEAKNGIVHVKIPQSNQGGVKTQRHFAYVEFGDEEAMRAGLAKKAEKLRDATPQVSIAEDNREPGSSRGRGRGGLAMRGLQAAGLGRQPSGRGKPLGDDN